ncbi:MAG: hypothetical protein RIE32_13370 [Phycisphaerales bacterium]
MGRVPFKGWLLLMLGASRAPLNAQEAEQMRRRRRDNAARGPNAASPTRVVEVPRPENRRHVEP